MVAKGSDDSVQFAARRSDLHNRASDNEGRPPTTIFRDLEKA